MSSPHLPPVEDLLRVLTLTELGHSRAAMPVVQSAGIASADGDRPIYTEELVVFTGESQPTPQGRAFGGQVLAQGLMACGLTVKPAAGEPQRHPHSLHAYFMRPGDSTQPITFTVEILRDGGSFSARRVHAIQGGQPILTLSASFQVTDDGLDHQEPMPQVPRPEELSSFADFFEGIDDPRARHFREHAIELRPVSQPIFATPDEAGATRQEIWVRTVAPLPDDPLIHAAVLAYISDISLLEPVLRHHRLTWGDPRLRMASLDHAMWFHRPARADEWTLYTQWSPTATGGRGLGTGRLFSEDGRHVASVIQEGMVRVKQ